MALRHPSLATLLVLFLGGASRWTLDAAAQSREVGIAVGVSGVLSGTSVNPVPGGGGKTEFLLEQPLVSVTGHALGEHLRFSGAVSFDKLTTDNGVLTLGAWGGGFYDRQHPHDYLHEATLSLVGNISGERHSGRIWLTGGKGVVPFGSDPPHERPALHVPVNHHWSQIMERPLVILGLRMGHFGVEATFFDGRDGSETKVVSSDTADTASHGHGGLGNDSPARTGFGQSRTVRLTWRPSSTLEVRGSLGTLKAPGHHPGASATTQMWNLSTQFARPSEKGRATVMAEVGRAWAGRPFWTGLAEGQWAWRQHRLYYRVERTDRPEGPRRADLFRGASDTLGTAPVGATRWLIQTAGYGVRVRSGVVTVEPVVEFAVGRVSDIGKSPVDLNALYGRRTLWSGVLALKLSVGGGHAMGHQH